MPSTVLPKSILDYSRLSRQEVGLLLKLHEAGKTQTEIAETLGCSQPSVSRWVSELCDTRTEAKQVLHNGAQKLAKRVVSEASVEQSLDVLERLEVITPRVQQDSLRTAVQINVGMPGTPAGPDPLSAVNIISSYQTRTDSAALTGQVLTALTQGPDQAKVEGESQ